MAEGKILQNQRNLAKKASSSHQVQKIQNEVNIYDTTEKDMQIYFHPDFRSPALNQYQTVYEPEVDQQREKDFVLRLQT